MQHPWNPQLFSAGARAAGRDSAFIEAALESASRIKDVHPDLPVVLTLSHLAHLVEVPSPVLREIVDRRTNSYRVFRLKKRARGTRTAAPRRAFRTICVPNPALMRTQRWIAQNILNVGTPHAASFGFIPDRSLTDAADRHVSCRWLVKMDVRNFFESITESAVYDVFVAFGYGALLSFELARLCTKSPSDHVSTTSIGILQSTLPYSRRAEGHLPQGAPTSPMLANFAVRQLDERLSDIAKAFKWTYTRYADDLAFSTKATTSGRREAMKLIAHVKMALGKFGLEANQSKTHVAPPGARRILLGLQVDQPKPHLSRSFKNNLETHLYALTSPKIGVAAHRAKRGFASTIGMKRHIGGLIAFAHQVDPTYAQTQYGKFNTIDWAS